MPSTAFVAFVAFADSSNTHTKVKFSLHVLSTGERERSIEEENRRRSPCEKKEQRHRDNYEVLPSQVRNKKEVKREKTG